MKAKTIIGIVLVVVIGLVLTGLYLEDKNNSTGDEYINENIELVEVELGDISNSLKIKGEIYGEKSEFIELDSDIKVIHILIKDGSLISKGDSLFTVDIDAVNSNLKTYTAKLNEKLKEYSKIKEKYTRIDVLAKNDGTIVLNNLEKGKKTDEILKTGNLLEIEENDEKNIYSFEYADATIQSIGSKTKYGEKVKKGSVLFSLKIKDSSIKTKEKEIEEIEKTIECLINLKQNSQYLADENGVIKEILISENTSYNSKTNLIEYIPFDKICVRIQVSKKDISKFSNGLSSTITLANGETVTSSVTNIDYIANESEKYNVLLDLDLNNQLVKDVIYIGSEATVNVEFSKVSDAIIVPANAIGEDSTGDYVTAYTGNIDEINTYTVETIPTQKIYVEKGIITSTKSEVISGLSGSEHIIIVKENSEIN